MTDQIPNTNPIPSDQKTNRIKLLIEPILMKFKQSRIYSNKKIFYPLVTALGLILLTIVVGLLFRGIVKTGVNGTTTTPTPFVSQYSPTASPSGDILSQIGQKLFDIQTQISTLDVKQSRLQPPSLNLKISF